MDRLLPRRSDYAGLRRSWRADLLASVTVGVVALSLALAFSVTSGVVATAGLITAIAAGVTIVDDLPAAIACAREIVRGDR